MIYYYHITSEDKTQQILNKKKGIGRYEKNTIRKF